MSKRKRKFGVLIVVLIMVVSAGCLGFGGSDPAPEQPTNETNETNTTDGNNDIPQNNTTVVEPNGALDDSMSPDEIFSRTTGDMIEVSPYGYTMNSESTSTVDGDPSIEIVEERSQEAVVNDFSENELIDFETRIESVSGGETTTIDESGTYFGSPNINATSPDGNNTWTIADHTEYQNPYHLIRMNYDSSNTNVRIDDPDTIIISGTASDISMNPTTTRTASGFPDPDIESETVEFTMEIQNMENSPNVVESITLSQDVRGTVIVAEDGSRGDFEMESSTTVDYRYDVNDIQTPDYFTEDNTDTEN